MTQTTGTRTYNVSPKGIRQTDAEEALSDARFYADELTRAIRKLEEAVLIHEDDVPTNRFDIKALRIASGALFELLSNLDPEDEQ